jgi:hypothetical protein
VPRPKPIDRLSDYGKRLQKHSKTYFKCSNENPLHPSHDSDETFQRFLDSRGGAKRRSLLEMDDAQRAGIKLGDPRV